MKLRFSKMHGAGNDYIYVNGFDTELPDPAALAVRLSDRHFGVGGDGLVVLLPSEKADVRMRMWNADGSEGAMCGNAIRCVGKYAYDHGLISAERLTVETNSGIKTLTLTFTDGAVTGARVDMGAPRLHPAELPVLLPGERAVDAPIEAAGKRWRMTCVSMGNPHAVIFTENVAALPLERIGPLFERHPLFPDRVNTEFAEPLPEGGWFMRVWERGSGETLACGTGASAVAVACVLTGRARRGEPIPVRLRGGLLRIEWSEAGGVLMEGPAEQVFDGELTV